MPKARVIRQLGPPEAMRWLDWPAPEAGPGEVRIRHIAIGVSFADADRLADPHVLEVAAADGAMERVAREGEKARRFRTV